MLGNLHENVLDWHPGMVESVKGRPQGLDRICAPPEPHGDQRRLPAEPLDPPGCHVESVAVETVLDQFLGRCQSAQGLELHHSRRRWHHVATVAYVGEPKHYKIPNSKI